MTEESLCGSSHVAKTRKRADVFDQKLCLQKVSVYYSGSRTTQRLNYNSLLFQFHHLNKLSDDGIVMTSHMEGLA